MDFTREDPNRDSAKTGRSTGKHIVNVEDADHLWRIAGLEPVRVGDQDHPERLQHRKPDRRRPRRAGGLQYRGFGGADVERQELIARPRRHKQHRAIPGHRQTDRVPTGCRSCQNRGFRVPDRTVQIDAAHRTGAPQPAVKRCGEGQPVRQVRRPHALHFARREERFAVGGQRHAHRRNIHRHLRNNRLLGGGAPQRLVDIDHRDRVIVLVAGKQDPFVGRRKNLCRVIVATVMHGPDVRVRARITRRHRVDQHDPMTVRDGQHAVSAQQLQPPRRGRQ